MDFGDLLCARCVVEDPTLLAQGAPRGRRMSSVAGPAMAAGTPVTLVNGMLVCLRHAMDELGVEQPTSPPAPHAAATPAVPAEPPATPPPVPPVDPGKGRVK